MYESDVESRPQITRKQRKPLVRIEEGIFAPTIEALGQFHFLLKSDPGGPDNLNSVPSFLRFIDT